jgi:AraC-like DNA-binding protein
MTADNNLKKRKIDPADTKQQITDIQVHLLCCRYWMLSEWECANMASPFWRLYHNTQSGAEIMFMDKWYKLEKDILLLIPPHTAYANSLKHQLVKADQERIVGKRIELSDTITQGIAETMIDHLFVHFNLGMSFDIVEPQIFVIHCNERQLELLAKIKEATVASPHQLSTANVLNVNILILESLLTISPQNLNKDINDRRVVEAISYMRDYDLIKVSNEELAARANMATNAFARLFKENTGVTIQQYLMKIRIEKACHMMHHSSHSIDDIAHRCGFFDRHHFSKAFKQALNVTPAYYMKKLAMMP